MKRLLQWASVALLPTSLMFAAAPAMAQTARSAPACMVAGPSVTRAGGQLMVIVPATAEQVMAARGYARQPCHGSTADLTGYRTQVCHLALKADDIIQSQFIAMWKVSPKELCAYADIVARP